MRKLLTVILFLTSALVPNTVDEAFASGPQNAHPSTRLHLSNTPNSNLIISRDGSKIYALSDTGGFSEFNSDSGAVIRTVKFNEEGYEQGKNIVVDSTETYAYVTSAAEIAQINLSTFKITTLPIPDLTTSPYLQISLDGQKLYAFGDDGERSILLIFKTSSFNLIKNIALLPFAVQDSDYVYYRGDNVPIEVSPDGTKIAVWNLNENGVHFISTSTNAISRVELGQNSRLANFAFTSDGSHFLAELGGNFYSFRSTNENTELWTLDTETSHSCENPLSPDATFDDIVFLDSIIDVRGGNCIGTLAGGKFLASDASTSRFWTTGKYSYQYGWGIYELREFKLGLAGFALESKTLLSGDIPQMGINQSRSIIYSWDNYGLFSQVSLTGPLVELQDEISPLWIDSGDITRICFEELFRDGSSLYDWNQSDRYEVKYYIDDEWVQTVWADNYENEYQNTFCSDDVFVSRVVGEHLFKVVARVRDQSGHNSYLERTDRINSSGFEPEGTFDDSVDDVYLIGSKATFHFYLDSAAGLPKYVRWRSKTGLSSWGGWKKVTKNITDIKIKLTLLKKVRLQIEVPASRYTVKTYFEQTIKVGPEIRITSNSRLFGTGSSYKFSVSVDRRYSGPCTWMPYQAPSEYWDAGYSDVQRPLKISGGKGTFNFKTYIDGYYRLVVFCGGSKTHWSQSAGGKLIRFLPAQ